MPSFAFLTLPAAGHFNPTLAIVAELVDRGSEVFYFSPAEMRARVEDAGARWIDRPRSAGTAGAAGLAETAIRRLPYWMAAAAVERVPPLVERLEALRPDVAVCNELDLTARLATCAARLTGASFRPFHAAPRSASRSPPVPEDLSRRAALGLAGWAARYGLPPTSLAEVVRGRERLRLVLLPRRFQAAVEAFDDRYLFVGPSLARPQPAPWPFTPPAGTRPRRAYISLGTLRNDKPAFYRLCLKAFARGGWEVVMSIGERTEGAALGDVPTNFDVRAFVPQLALLAQTDVFVTHGGLNSVMEAMWSGVPVVVVPEIGEQRLTAARVAELGLGVALEHAGLTADSLLGAARHAADDPEVRTRVDAMREEAHHAGGARRAARALIRYAQNGAAAQMKSGSAGLIY